MFVGFVFGQGFKGVDETENTDRDSGFLPHLSGKGSLQAFPMLDLAAGDRPMPLKGWLGAFYQQHIAIAENDRANRDNGVGDRTPAFVRGGLGV